MSIPSSQSPIPQKRKRKGKNQDIISISMDLYHSILTPSQVENAKIVFASFADTVVGNGERPTHMGVLAVLKYFGTIGIKFTENEVKDLIMSISQSSSLPEENTSAPSASAIPAVSPTRRPPSSSATSKKRRGSSSPPVRVQMTPVQPPLDQASSSTLALSFENFLSLSLQTFSGPSGDCDFQAEMKSTFNAIDFDRDGFISFHDLRKTLVKQFVDPYVGSESKQEFPNPHIDLPKLTESQIGSILSELDVGCDGGVSFNDFCTAMLTS